MNQTATEYQSKHFARSDLVRRRKRISDNRFVEKLKREGFSASEIDSLLTIGRTGTAVSVGTRETPFVAVDVAPASVGKSAMAKIMTAVSQAAQISEVRLKSESRSYPIPHARQVFFALARQRTKASLAAIGRACGGRDHSTVLYGSRKVEQHPEMFRVLLEKTEAILKAADAVNFEQPGFPPVDPAQAVGGAVPPALSTAAIIWGRLS